MQVLKIEWVRPFHFRAFGETGPITLEDQLTIFYGGNGTGKSSLAEAVEWLLFGYTTRRRKGDNLSKEEYRGTYARNVDDCPVDPFVEASIRLSDGSSHLIRRTMMLPGTGRFDDTQSMLTIDGVAGEFSDIGLSISPVYNPVVAQHGIQDTIHTRPIERYRALSDALGLTDLVALKDALTSARILYRNDPPDRVTIARAETKSLPSRLRDLGLDSIATRWSNGNYQLQQDYAEIISVASALLEQDVEGVQQLVPVLRKAQAREMRRVFDISPFRPRTDSSELLGRLEEQRDQFDGRVGSLVGAVRALIESSLTEFEARYVEFWRSGISILDELGEEQDPRLCPFCEERTVTSDLLKKRCEQVERAAGSLQAKRNLEKKADDCTDVVTEVLRTIGQIRIKSLGDEDRAKLRKVFGKSPELLESFLEACDEFNLTTTDLYEQVETIKQRIRALRSSAEGEQAVEIPSRARQLVDGLEKLLRRFLDSFETYRKAFSEFEPVLRVELSDEQTVRMYTAAISLLEAKSSVAVCAANGQLEDDLLECQRSVAKYVKNKQKEILDIREAEMLSWYERLSPGATTTFSGIEPATDRFILKAECFGMELSAPACLSHSQLNCLGLSIWIPSVTATLSPFQFLVFDDPVQAMDDDHKDSFIIKIVPHLIEQEQVQVVVLTHLKMIADRLRQEHYHLNPCYYCFDSLTADGVQLSEFYPVEDEIRHIKTLMASANEASRKLAVDRIRVLCEHVMREAYLHECGVPLPEEYAVATPSELLKPFAGLSSVSPKKKQGVRGTVKWSDPAHHTDKTWQVPSASNIQPHLSRLENIAKDLELI
ncbi:MAG: AAA family ATPase [bacterium]